MTLLSNLFSRMKSRMKDLKKIGLAFNQMIKEKEFSENDEDYSSKMEIFS